MCGGGKCEHNVPPSLEGASSSCFSYSTTRSTLFMLTSSSVTCRTIQFMMPAHSVVREGGEEERADERGEEVSNTRSVKRRY